MILIYVQFDSEHEFESFRKVWLSNRMSWTMGASTYGRYFLSYNL